MLFSPSCRFEAELVNELTAKLLRDFGTQARPPAEHEVGLEEHVAYVEGLLKEKKVTGHILRSVILFAFLTMQK